MKYLIASLFILSFATISSAQNFRLNIPGIAQVAVPNRIMNSPKLISIVRRIYDHPVRKEALEKALLMRDIYEYYPSAWIEDYVSTRITTIYKGESIQAEGTTERLTMLQKTMLANADVNTKVLIDVRYRTKNAVTAAIEIREMHYSVAVVPEVEAEPADANLSQSLKQNIEQEIGQSNIEKYQRGTVHFTINENGAVENAKIFESSGDAKTDELLLRLINNMPKWKPAKDIMGNPVKQDFEFLTGYLYEGC